VNISNMDTHYYQNHDLTIAQHPSENNLRFMIRLIAFMANAHERLVFTKGLSTDDEPELWKKSLVGEIELWIDLGQPDEKRIRKACGRSQQVIIYTYHEGKSTVWWQQQREKLSRFKNLKVFKINVGDIEGLVERTMSLQCTIQDGEMYLATDDMNIAVSINAHN